MGKIKKFFSCWGIIIAYSGAVSLFLGIMLTALSFVVKFTMMFFGIWGLIILVFLIITALLSLILVADGEF